MVSTRKWICKEANTFANLFSGESHLLVDFWIEENKSKCVLIWHFNLSFHNRLRILIYDHQVYLPSGFESFGLHLIALRIVWKIVKWQWACNCGNLSCVQAVTTKQWGAWGLKVVVGEGGTCREFVSTCVMLPRVMRSFSFAAQCAVCTVSFPYDRTRWNIKQSSIKYPKNRLKPGFHVCVKPKKHIAGISDLAALARQLIWKGILIYRRYIGAGCTRSAVKFLKVER